MKPDGDLAGELRSLDDYTVRSRKDAKAICAALSTLGSRPSPQKEEPFSSDLRALTALFQDVDGRDAPAFDVLYDEGLPELIRIFDATIARDSEDDEQDLMFVLKILAMYGSRAGAERIVESAKRPLFPGSYMWHMILSAFSDGHPHRDYVFRALSDPLPSEFTAVALLDSANAVAIEGDLQNHPFDSEAGWRKLENWLEDSDPDRASYAHSATAALPFIKNPPRDQLLALAMEHIDTRVQMEAAWAAGKLGREAGLKILARLCLDVAHSDVAQRYLVELDREELIPAEAKDASFQAKAEFANWLAHPNELGRAPDELEIVDHRELRWPPARQSQPFWLLRYVSRDRTGLEEDDVGCGLVGSATWCFFSYAMHQRPPEDAYAIHCYWEMTNGDLIRESEVTDASEYAGLLSQWQAARPDSAVVTRVAELSPKLKVPAQFVALASAEVDDQDGWIVLDGPRSAWYPKAEQPEGTYEGVILKIHIGRQLLGFQDPPNRRDYFVTQRRHRPPQEFIAAYEKLLSEVPEAVPQRQEELLGSRSLLARHLRTYVDAYAEVNGSDRSVTVVRVYERFLELAEQSDRPVRDEAYESFSVLGENFDTYVEALLAQKRLTEVDRVIELFTPRWDHNLGYGKLGSAAFRAGRTETAERFLLKIREGLESYYRSEEMSMLAEIWHARGEERQARDLLVDCLQKLVIAIAESEYRSDQQMFADEFRYHRSTYARLFPQGEAELAELGIPTEPL